MDTRVKPAYDESCAELLLRRLLRHRRLVPATVARRMSRGCDWS